MRESSQDKDEEYMDEDNDGFLQVVDQTEQQLELFNMDEIVRPDYNIGKYATIIFASPYLKDLDTKRTINLPVKGNKEAKASIQIHPLIEQIVPTTTTFKVLMGLIQIWTLQGRNPSGMIGYSDRQLAHVIGWKFSGKTAKRITDHIDILQGTTIDWIAIFKRGSETARAVRKMSLLSDAAYIKRSEMTKGERFQSIQTVTLHQDMVQNMLNDVVRPINFEALRQISSDASTRLYMSLDMWLAKKTIVARRARALLVDDLHYEGKRYDNKGERKRTLERLIRDLDGKELTSGKLALVMEETADGKDWKLVARKVGRIKPARKFLKPVMDGQGAEMLADDLEPLFEGGAPYRKYLVFLCQHYPETVIRDALSRARNDYQGNVKKSIGAIFRWELEQIVKGRGDLKWHKPSRKKSSDSE